MADTATAALEDEECDVFYGYGDDREDLFTGGTEEEVPVADKNSVHLTDDGRILADEKWVGAAFLLNGDQFFSLNKSNSTHK